LYQFKNINFKRICTRSPLASATPPTMPYREPSSPSTIAALTFPAPITWKAPSQTTISCRGEGSPRTSLEKPRETCFSLNAGTLLKVFILKLRKKGERNSDSMTSSRNARGISRNRSRLTRRSKIEFKSSMKSRCSFSLRSIFSPLTKRDYRLQTSIWSRRSRNSNSSK